MDGKGNSGVFNPRNLSLFSYTYNNPVTLVDPDGKLPWHKSKIGGGKGGLVAAGRNGGVYVDKGGNINVSRSFKPKTKAAKRAAKRKANIPTSRGNIGKKRDPKIASSDKSSESESSMLTIDANNEAFVVSTLLESIDIATPQLPSTEIKSNDNSELAKLLPSYPNYYAPEIVNDAYSCVESGSISYQTDKSTIIYDNCQENGTLTNDKLKVTKDETNGATTYELTDYKLVSDKKEYSTSCTSYTVKSGSISFTSKGETKVNDLTIYFKDYHYDLTLENEKLDISIKGLVSSSESDKWFEVKTNTNMQFYHSACPISGEIEVVGDNSSLNLIFRNDQSSDA
jgi:hypothetical protein